MGELDKGAWLAIIQLIMRKTQTILNKSSGS